MAEAEDIPALTAFDFPAGQVAGLHRTPVQTTWPEPMSPRMKGQTSSRMPRSRPSDAIAIESTPDPREPAVILRLSPALEARTFQIPDSARETLDALEKTGSLTLVVEIGETGRPESVFVERSSGDQAFDRAALHAVYQGQGSASASGSGRVWIAR